jgi:riboflavin synthase, alpha subunit
MFTGIIQDLGTIKAKEEGLYQISTNLDLSKCKDGSSISCNGVCLTAKNITQTDNKSFTFEVNLGEETLQRTNLANSILKNEKINLEKSLQIGDEISGHFVYGHVDTITTVNEIIELENSWEYHFKKNFNKNNRFIVEKGSISINGISLTVAKVENKTFMISVIDHTYNYTNLKFINKSDQVNIEFDYLARFIFNNE